MCRKIIKCEKKKMNNREIMISKLKFIFDNLLFITRCCLYNFISHKKRSKRIITAFMYINIYVLKISEYIYIYEYIY